MSFIDKLKGMFGPKHAHHPHEHSREECDCENDPEAKEVCECGKENCTPENCEKEGGCDCGHAH
ncbi:MAG: hypothetical protein WC813_01635 [Patescibacteria group bacterium]|jgi:hypothetical protein